MKVGGIMFLVRTLKINEVPDGELFEIHDVIPHDRAPGYFRKLDEAFDCISRNCGDMFEDGYYNYAVIEQIGQGLYPNIREVQWFFYNRGDGSILTVERPHMLGDHRYAENDILSTYIG